MKKSELRMRRKAWRHISLGLSNFNYINDRTLKEKSVDK